MSDYRSENAVGFTIVGVAASVFIVGFLNNKYSESENSKQELKVLLEFEKVRVSECNNIFGLVDAIDDALEAGNSGRVVVSKGENGNCEYDFMPDPQ